MKRVLFLLIAVVFIFSACAGEAPVAEPDITTPITTTPPPTTTTTPTTTFPATTTTSLVTTTETLPEFDFNIPLFETVNNEDVRDMLALIHGRTIYRFQDEFTNINEIPLDVFLLYICYNNRTIRSTHTPDEVIIGEGCSDCTVNYGNCAMGYPCSLFYKPETVEAILKDYINPNILIQNYDLSKYTEESGGWRWQWNTETGLFWFNGYIGPVRDVITQSFPIIEDAYLIEDMYYIVIVETQLSYGFVGDFRGIHIGDDELGEFLCESQWLQGSEWWREDNLWTLEMLNLNETYNDAPRYLYTFKRNADGLMNIYSRELVGV